MKVSVISLLLGELGGLGGGLINDVMLKTLGGDSRLIFHFNVIKGQFMQSLV